MVVMQLVHHTQSINSGRSVPNIHIVAYCNVLKPSHIWTTACDLGAQAVITTDVGRYVRECNWYIKVYDKTVIYDTQQRTYAKQCCGSRDRVVCAYYEYWRSIHGKIILHTGKEHYLENLRGLHFATFITEKMSLVKDNLEAVVPEHVIDYLVPLELSII